MDAPERTMGEWAQVFCDLVLLNLLWLVCCLPVVTIGASTAALHTVARKMAAGEHYTVWSGFWQGFRENWKQGTAVVLLFGVVVLLCWADVTIGMNNPGGLGIACQIVGALGMIASIFTLSLTFPVLTRYRLPLRAVLKNALVLSLANPHIVLADLAAAALFPVLGALNIYLRIIATPLWLLLGGGLPVLAQQLLMRKVYARLEAGKTMEESNHGDSEAETHL